MTAKELIWRDIRDTLRGVPLYSCPVVLKREVVAEVRRVLERYVGDERAWGLEVSVHATASGDRLILMEGMWPPIRVRIG